MPSADGNSSRTESESGVSSSGKSQLSAIDASMTTLFEGHEPGHRSLLLCDGDLRTLADLLQEFRELGFHLECSDNL